MEDVGHSYPSEVMVLQMAKGLENTILVKVCTFLDLRSHSTTHFETMVDLYTR